MRFAEHQHEPAPGRVDRPWDDLVVSILAVNQYSLEKTYGGLEGLRTTNVTDPANLRDWKPEEMTAKLRAAGFDRGSFMTALFAQRLCALGELIRARGITECESVLSGRNRRSIEAVLLPVKGIGPKVLKNFFMLRGLDADSKG